MSRVEEFVEVVVDYFLLEAWCFKRFERRLQSGSQLKCGCFCYLLKVVPVRGS